MSLLLPDFSEELTAVIVWRPHIELLKSSDQHLKGVEYNNCKQYVLLLALF